MLLRSGAAANLRQAAAMSGSNINYVQAMTILLSHGDDQLIVMAERGDTALLVAAARVKPRVRLLRAYHAASPNDRVAVVKLIGPEQMFDVVSAAL
jgi:hypothetical protein